MLQIVLDAEKVFTTSEKILTALLGALFGFGIKAFYDWRSEKKRLKDIRDMIYIDLLQQEKKFKYLGQIYGTYKRFVDYRRKELVTFDTTPLNLSIFKAHTSKDYYKAFNLQYYQNLLDLYYTIENYSENSVIKIYLKFSHDIMKSHESLHEGIIEAYREGFFLSNFHAELILGNIQNLMKLHGKSYRFKKQKELGKH